MKLWPDPTWKSWSEMLGRLGIACILTAIAVFGFGYWLDIKHEIRSSVLGYFLGYTFIVALIGWTMAMVFGDRSLDKARRRYAATYALIAYVAIVVFCPVFGEARITR